MIPTYDRKKQLLWRWGHLRKGGYRGDRDPGIEEGHRGYETSAEEVITEMATPAEE